MHGVGKVDGQHVIDHQINKHRVTLLGGRGVHVGGGVSNVGYLVCLAAGLGHCGSWMDPKVPELWYPLLQPRQGELGGPKVVLDVEQAGGRDNDLNPAG